MAGTVNQSMDFADYSPGAKVVSFVCTGDSSNGSIPSTLMSTVFYEIIRKNNCYLYQVVAFPTSGGTAPDAADVTVTMDGQDLLGGQGVGLIHATATQDVFPYSAFMTSYRFPLITNNLTLAVANQATASANFTILLKFVR